MNALVDALLTQALVLPEASRLELAERLLVSVPDDDERELHAVIQGRIDEVESGRVATIPAEHVYKEIEALMASGSGTSSIIQKPASRLWNRQGITVKTATGLGLSFWQH
jgi:hypothetical protein